MFTVDGVILTADTARERNTEPIIIVDPKKEGSVVVYVVIVLVCIVLSAIITVVLVTVILLNRRYVLAPSAVSMMKAHASPHSVLHNN